MKKKGLGYGFIGWLLSFLVVGAMGAQASDVPVKNLTARCWAGQVFLRWDEAEAPAGSSFNVYMYEHPIRTAHDLTNAVRLGHHVEAHSARDWWADPSSFDGKASPVAAVGFVIESAGERLDPQGGLFVHTVSKADEGERYYAVTTSDAQGIEDTRIVGGDNCLLQPIRQEFGVTEAVWIGHGAPPERGSGKAKNLVFWLHGRGGGGGKNTNFVVYGDARQGWREGLAYKFEVELTEEAVVIRPADRMWTNRPVVESPDNRDHVPAVNTWWFGCNSQIYKSTLLEHRVVVNYTEERLLWLVRWAQRYFGTNVNRCYLSGSSMGGSGAVSMALHHPNLFAAVYAQVPVVSYTRNKIGRGRGSVSRLECICGPLHEKVMTNQAVPVLDYMNGTLMVQQARVDLPPVFLMNGRKDGSIPWSNNPPFYQALNGTRQGFAVYWDGGSHGMWKNVPDDVAGWKELMLKFRLDVSYPGFSNCSTNKNPGNGDPQDGDIVGWMNRGLGWADVVDDPQRYGITVTCGYPGMSYPVTVDVTLRRVQRFKVRPGEKLIAKVGAEPDREVYVDEYGLITLPRVAILSAEGTRITLVFLIIAPFSSAKLLKIIKFPQYIL